MSYRLNWRLNLNPYIEQTHNHNMIKVILFLASLYLGYIYSFVIYGKYDKKQLLIIYMLTLICTLPLYATLNIVISRSLAPLGDTVENIDFKICASLGFCAITNAFVVYIRYLFALIEYINSHTGGELKILGSIVDQKKRIVKVFRVQSWAMLAFALSSTWFSHA